MSDTELQSSRESVRALYEQARRLHKELLGLQKVDQARAAFKEVLGGEERRLESLRQRVSALERDKQSLLERLERPPADVQEPDAEDDYEAAAAVGAAAPKKGGREAVKEELANAARLTLARKRFQELVNRFRHYLQVSEAHRAQINQIVEDPQRPLGEALVLLEWDAFENRVGPPGAESDGKYLERLNDWSESLREYVKKAEGDVRTVEVRYGELVMRLWRAWSAAAAGDRTQWEQLIKNMRVAFAHEADKLEKQVVTLEAEIAAMKGGPGAEAGHER